MAGAGPGLLEIVNNGTGTSRAKVEYYESVSMAFGLRPYELKCKCHFVLEFSIENAEIMWNCTWKMMVF